MNKTEKKRKFIIDIFFIVVILALVYVAVEYLMIWLLPFVIGLIVAIVLQRPVAWLTQKTKVARGFWSCLLVLTVLCAIFALIFLVVWQLTKEVPGFTKWLMGLAPDIKHTFTSLMAWFSIITERLPVDVMKAITNLPSTLVDTAVSGVTSILTIFAEKIIVDGPGLLISTIFSIVASCYITKDYNKITRFILLQLNEKQREVVINVKRLFVTNILSMLRGYIIIMFITYLEILIGLSILKVEYAPILAAFIAVLDILPVVGTGTVLIPWGIISLCIGNIYMGVGLLIVYVLITIIRNIIEPKIIGDQVGLPPIVTLVAMYVGLKIFGVVGMLLLPVSIIIIVKLQENGIIHIWNIPEKDDTHKVPLMRRLFSKKEKKSQSKSAGSDE